MEAKEGWRVEGRRRMQRSRAVAKGGGRGWRPRTEADGGGQGLRSRWKASTETKGGRRFEGGG